MTFQQPAGRAPAIPTALQQVWPIDGGEVEFTIRSTKTLPAKAYASIAELVEKADALVDLLGVPLAPAGREAADALEQTTVRPKSAES